MNSEPFISQQSLDRMARYKADPQTPRVTFLTAIVGPGWSEAEQAYVENAAERRSRPRSGASGRGWWFEQMVKECSALKDNYCRICGTLLNNGRCPKGCR